MTPQMKVQNGRLAVLREADQWAIDALGELTGLSREEIVAKSPLNHVFGDNIRLTIPIPGEPDKVAAEVKWLVDTYESPFVIDFAQLTASAKEAREYEGKVHRKTIVWPLSTFLTKAKQAADDAIEGGSRAAIGSKQLDFLFPLSGDEYHIGSAYKISDVCAKALNHYERLKTAQLTHDGRHPGDKAIILSRHPIDVLRMSDMDQIGTSCHSIAASHFDSCLAHAIEGTAIAFAVPKESVANLDDEFFRSANEIFADQERNLTGLEATERVLVRAFANKRTKTSLAVPEMKFYPHKGRFESTPGFGRALNNFLIKKNETNLRSMISADRRLDLADFVPVGGDYVDSGNEDDTGLRAILRNITSEEDQQFRGKIERSGNNPKYMKRFVSRADPVTPKGWKILVRQMVDKFSSTFSNPRQKIVAYERENGGFAVDGYSSFAFEHPFPTQYLSRFSKGDNLSQKDKMELIKKFTNSNSVDERLERIFHEILQEYDSKRHFIVSVSASLKDLNTLMLRVDVQTDEHVMLAPGNSLPGIQDALTVLATDLEYAFEILKSKEFRDTITDDFTSYSADRLEGKPLAESLTFHGLNFSRHVAPGCGPLLVPRVMMLTNKERKRLKI